MAAVGARPDPWLRGGCAVDARSNSLAPAAGGRARSNSAGTYEPILASSCIKCHARGRAKGGLQIDTRETLLRGGDSGPVVVAGQSQASLLIALVAGVDPDEVMPKKGSRLTADQIGLLRAWIDQGLAWDPGITFARPAPLNLLPHSPRLEISHGEPNQSN